MLDTIAVVEENRELAKGYRLLTLRFEQDLQAEAGQFAMLKAHGSYEPLLRRALAVYRCESERQLSFLYQVLGRGTETLAALTTGNLVDVLLPLGNHWPVEQLTDSHSVLVVSGGIGSASLLMLCQQLKGDGREAKIFFGAASELSARGCGLSDFQELALPLFITTDDGSLGEKGFVTASFETELQLAGAKDRIVFTCGPWAMMKRVAELCEQYGVICFASLEAPMGCGFGVCVGCVVAMQTDEPLGYASYKRVCMEGAIFPADSIRWDVTAMSH